MRTARRLTWLLAAFGLMACKGDNPEADPVPSAQASTTSSAQPRAQATAAAATAAVSATSAGKQPEFVAKPAPRGPVQATPDAAAHLPADCDVMGHLDIAGTLALEPVKELLLPKLQAALDDKPQQPSAQGLHAFLEQASIKPLEDLKSMAFCVRQPLSNRPLFVAAIGGTLAANAVAQALAGSNPGRFKLMRVGGVEVAAFGDRQWLGQAKDGVILAANEQAMFETALSTSKAAEQAKLPIDKALSAQISGATVQQAARQAPNSPFSPHLLKVQRLSVVTDLATGQSASHIDMPDAASATALGGALKGAIGRLGKEPTDKLPAELVGLLGGTQVSYQGATLVLTLPHGKDKLRELAKMAGAAMMRRAGQVPSPTPVKPPRAPANGKPHPAPARDPGF